MDDVLGIEHVKSIEFQQVHRMSKPRNGSHKIIACFLRYSDREQDFTVIAVKP